MAVCRAAWGTGEEIERYAALVDRFACRLEDAVASASMPVTAEADTQLVVS